MLRHIWIEHKFYHRCQTCGRTAFKSRPVEIAKADIEDCPYRPEITFRPTIVCLCGSTRFMKEFQDQNMRLTLEGKIVLSVGMSSHGDCRPTEEQKKKLDELHLRKIDLADEVFVINVLRRICPRCGTPWIHARIQVEECSCGVEIGSVEPKGYLGKSTKQEIAYARKIGKPVTFLNPEEV